MKPEKKKITAYAPVSLSSSRGKEEEFIRSGTSSYPTLPWEDPRVREDMPKNFLLKISEPEYLKLSFVTEKLHRSKQKFCREALVQALEKALETLLAQSSKREN